MFANYSDIHAHILPDVDDGPRTLDEALSIIREAGEVGVKKIVCTPHILDLESADSILDKCARQFDILRRSADESRCGIDLVLGAELLLHPDLPEAVRRDRRLTVDGRGRHVLIEMPLFEIPPYARSVFFDLLVQGTIPVWAHPERCKQVVKDYRILEPFVHGGVLVQVNAGSLSGVYGWSVRRTAEKLLKAGLGHLCASDTHRIEHYRKRLPKAFARVEKIMGECKAAELFHEAPARVLG